MKHIITSLLATLIIFANINGAYAFSLKKNTTETQTEKIKLTKEEKLAQKAAKAEEKKQIKEQIKIAKQQEKEEKKALKEQRKIEKQQAKEEQKLIKQQKKALKKKNKITEEKIDEITEQDEIQNSEEQAQDIIVDKKTAKQQAKALKKEQKEKAKAEKKALKEAERQAMLKAKNKGVKKRSALAMFLNPNLDVYEIRASHILVKKRKDAVAIRKDIISGQITFEEAAQRYSLCPSGPNGGDLGYFTRRKMEQLFADTAFDLKIGEISQPVGTKFGWHIIKTTDKR